MWLLRRGNDAGHAGLHQNRSPDGAKAKSGAGLSKKPSATPDYATADGRSIRATTAPYRRIFRNVFFHAMVSINDFSASLSRTTLPSSARVKRTTVFSSS